MRAFRFGLLVERFSSPAYVLDVARAAEAAGFSTLLIRDHLIDGPFGPQYAPWTTLATVAAATRTLRVGTMVTANDFRHPAVLAKEVTTLDQLSGGRVELGIGAGFLREEYDRAGLAFDSNKVRVDRLAEALDVLDALLAARPLTYHGQQYAFDDFVNFPPPVQRPRPPLLVAGAGPRMLSLAARHADIVGVLAAPLSSGTLVDSAEARSPDNMRAQLQLVQNAAPDRFDMLEFSMIATFVVTSDRRAAAEQLAHSRGWHVSADDALQMPTVLCGSPYQIIDALNQRREHYHLTYVVLRDSQLADAAPIVRHLSGT